MNTTNNIIQQYIKSSFLSSLLVSFKDQVEGVDSGATAILFICTFIIIIITIYIINMEDTPLKEIPTPNPSNTTSTQNVTNNNNNNNNVKPPQQQQVGNFHLESGGLFTMKEYNTLVVICDTILSNDTLSDTITLDYSDQKTVTIIKEYFSRSSSDLDIANHFLKLVSSKPRSQVEDLKKLLYLFSSSTGFILTGSLTPFTMLSVDKRQKIMLMMKTSINPLRRQAFRAICPLTCSLYFTVLNQNGINPNWSALKYELPPPAEQIPRQENLTFINITSERSLKADVVVIGSGAGGGVTAAILADAGYSVIVLEKGSYVAPNAMTWKEAEAYPLLYEQAASLTSDDLGVNIIAGSCVGGGTTVNWAASIETPLHVLEEWRKECPKTFEEARYADATAEVSKRLNVNKDESVRNRPNQLLSQALDELGFDNDVIPRNVKNCDTTQCGYCSMGCRTRSKQSSMVTYLEDACAKGAQIIANCQAEEITSTVVKGSGPTVHGVVAIVTHPDGERFRVFIKSSIVVSSAGALHTPALLLRSGLRNSNIGKTLYLHPVCPVIGIFDKEKEKDGVQVWDGVPMSVVSREFQNKYGSIIEVPNAHLAVASMIGSWLWESSSDFKSKIINVKQWSCFIPILRDRIPGKVKLDRDGRSPKITYKLSDQDWKTFIDGIEGTIKTMVQAGASNIVLPIAGLPIHSSNDHETLIKTLKNTKYKPNQVAILSAHQMGSCRMGNSKSNSVVNQDGESWDMKRLFVADGSVLPSSVGVNPMITIYSVSYLIAKSIINLYPPGISYERGV